MSQSDAPVFAAIDVGSNSFHMVVARYEEGRVQILDRMKDMVRLADGLDENRFLSTEAMDRGLACLQQFSQRIQEIPPSNVRAVGTNALRQARNSLEFLRRAQQALGHRIQIIAGREEARLIYLGVAHTVYKENEQRLVVDIGGGSTEIVIGRDFKPMLMESLYVGCVNMTRRFFNDGKVSSRRMRNAILYAQQELEAIERQYKHRGWESVIGSSGTIITIEKVLALHGWSQGGITVEGLDQLRSVLIDARHYKELKLEGLSDKRQPVFAGGVAVLSAVFRSLALEQMTTSDGALREGLLYELIGRIQQKDVREETVAELQVRYNIDTDHAGRVQATALYCLDKLNREPVQAERGCLESERLLLSWASRLHEVGLAIAHSQYQKHGGYLLQHSDMPGFARQEQQSLGSLVRNHRRKINPDDFRLLPEETDNRLLRLCILLRMAVLLNRSRSNTPLPDFDLQGSADSLHVQFPRGWLGKHPLTGADLETEAAYLADAGYTLTYD